MESELISRFLILKAILIDTLCFLYSVIRPQEVPLETTPAGMGTVLDLQIPACLQSRYKNNKLSE